MLQSILPVQLNGGTNSKAQPAHGSMTSAPQLKPLSVPPKLVLQLLLIKPQLLPLLLPLKHKLLEHNWLLVPKNGAHLLVLRSLLQPHLFTIISKLKLMLHLPAEVFHQERLSKNFQESELNECILGKNNSIYYYVSLIGNICF